MAEDRDAIIAKLVGKVTGSYEVDGAVDVQTNVAEVVDSLDTMNYIFYLEEEFGLKIADEQVTSEKVLIISRTADLIVSSRL